MSTPTSKHFRIISHVAPAQHIREYPRATASPDATLHVAVKQYIPLNNPNPRPGDVTIIGATGNAIPKEAYEPLWEKLLVKAEGKFRVRSIWVADMASQGRSGRINEEVLGNDPSTNDHARDLLHFINMKREEMPLPIVGVGHSMGGHHIVHLALMHARLMHTIVCIEPAIVRRLTWSDSDAKSDKRTFYNMAFTAASSVRKDTWPSREKAAQALRRNPFFKTWDQRAFDRYVQYDGLREISSRQGGEKAVALTRTRHQEAFMFARPAYNVPPASATAHVTHPDHVEGITASGPFYRPECSLLFAQLPFLRPSVLYVFGNRSQCYTPELARDKLENTGTGPGGSGGVSRGRVKAVVIGGGHMIGVEKVEETAEVVIGWLEGETRRFAREMRVMEEGWTGRKREEKQTIDEEWVSHLPKRMSKGKEGKEAPNGSHGSPLKRD